MRFPTHALKICAGLGWLALGSCHSASPVRFGYRVIDVRPHDESSYTQGFHLEKGRLYESSGQYGESALREIDPATGKVLRRRPLAKTVFGEGLTIMDDKMWVLTWKEHTAYVFDPKTFKPLATHTYQGEGWGLANDGKYLIMSDGSDKLTFRSPEDFTIVRTLEVRDGNAPVKMLNELEVIEGQIFANIYLTDRIARISTETGKVTGWLDLAGLRNQLPRPNRAEVLNGIAWESATGRLLVTGKYWPRMFEIELTGK